MERGVKQVTYNKIEKEEKKKHLWGTIMNLQNIQMYKDDRYSSVIATTYGSSVQLIQMSKVNGANSQQ